MLSDQSKNAEQTPNPSRSINDLSPNVDSKKTAQVLFNSACPVCDAGIRYQQKRIASESVSWVDVSKTATSEIPISTDIEFIKERLHVLRDGQVCVGIDAFIALWRLSPKDQWKAQVFSLPIIHGLANVGYNLFARALYRWNRWSKRW